jgi:peptidoglycan biosynthesis protein MviN/MurJ (putative lipid II flippase)
LAGLLFFLMSLPIGAWFLLPRLDLAGLAAERASALLGRQVTIESLRVTPGWRVQFALSDVKRASMLVATAAILGVCAMAVASAVMSDSDRAAALALGYGTTQTLSAALLTWRVHQLTGYPTRRSMGRLGAGSLAAAVVAGVVMFGVGQWFDHTRLASLAAIVVAGCVGAVVFVACVSVFAGVRPRTLLGRAGGGG